MGSTWAISATADDAWCHGNCAKGYCPESFCECVADVCAADVQECSDGTSVSRDPANGCEFPACRVGRICLGANEEVKTCGTACESTCAVPSPICIEQCVLDVCQRKALHIRDANGVCILATACPAVCAADVQDCSDGTSVSRDPANGCEFPACTATCPGANEEVKTCGTACESTCAVPSPIC